MNRELLILRHGKATEPGSRVDFDRPLTDSGKRDVQRVGAWLEYNGLLPGRVLTSPAKRAADSAAKALKAGGLGARGIIELTRLYNAGIETLLDVLGDESPSNGHLMLVGHNPGLQSLVYHLADSPRSRHEVRSLLPGTLCRLAMPEDWKGLAKGCARIIDWVSPDTLPRKFSFPGPGGTELRDRPAYYYRQSAVIPYRVNGNELEILIISSSRKNHWVVPKGIHDPGLSARESAAREAEEEAGASGRVGVLPLGEYTFEKWGAPCRVVVYPMRVTAIRPHGEWEENHRDRRFVSPPEAAAQLKARELKRIVGEFAAGTTWYEE